jgi:hypothetical protein
VINSLVQGGDIPRVAWLCAGLLGVALLSAVLKFALNFRLSVLGERIVLLLRERLYANYVTDATTGAPDTPKRGTLVTMLSAEAEYVGAFAGSAIASPLMQIWHPDQRHRLHLCQPALARRPGARYRAPSGHRGGGPETYQSPGARTRADAARRIGPHFRDRSDAGGRRGRCRLSRSLRDPAQNLVPQAVVQVRAQRDPASPVRSVSSFSAGGWFCTDARR